METYRTHFMTESEYTEKVCVSTNCFMKTRSRTLKDSTKESFRSRDTRSAVWTSVMVCWYRLEHKPPKWSCTICATHASPSFQRPRTAQCLSLTSSVWGTCCLHMNTLFSKPERRDNWQRKEWLHDWNNPAAASAT